MNMLAQSTPTDPTNAAAWGAYIAALRGSLQTSWAGARNAYLTLKKVRADLGMPFVAPAVGEGGVPDNGAWTDSLEGNILDLQAMVKVTDDALGDVLAQKRKLLYDAQNNDYAVEGLPGDLVRVRTNQSGNLLLTDATNQPIHVGGTIGLAPIIVGGIVAAAALSGAVVFVGAALVIKKTCETVQVIAEQKTLQTALTKQAELVQSGKATPAEAAALTKGVYDGASALATAKGAAAAQANANSDVSSISKTVTTVAFIGLGIGVIYLLTKLIPEGGLKRSSAPSLLANPKEKSVYRQAKDLGIEVDHHESDLYLRDSQQTRRLLLRLGLDRRGKSSTFRDSEGRIWWDIPFAYDPFWTAKRRARA